MVDNAVLKVIAPNPKVPIILIYQCLFRELRLFYQYHLGNLNSPNTEHDNINLEMSAFSGRNKRLLYPSGIMFLGV